MEVQRAWLSSAPGSKDWGTEVVWTPQAWTTVADSLGLTRLVQVGQVSPNWQQGFGLVLQKDSQQHSWGWVMSPPSYAVGDHVWALQEATAGDGEVGVKETQPHFLGVR